MKLYEAIRMTNQTEATLLDQRQDKFDQLMDQVKDSLRTAYAYQEMHQLDYAEDMLLEIQDFFEAKRQAAKINNLEGEELDAFFE